MEVKLAPTSIKDGRSGEMSSDGKSSSCESICTTVGLSWNRKLGSGSIGILMTLDMKEF